MINVSTIESKFRRSNVKANKTFLWKNVSGTMREKILYKVNLLVDECIILVFYDSDQKFFILTNQRIVASDRDFFLSDMDNIGLNEIMRNPERKTTSTTLDITTKNNTSFALHVELGTWHVIYSILRFITLKNKSV